MVRIHDGVPLSKPCSSTSCKAFLFYGILNVCWRRHWRRNSTTPRSCRSPRSPLPCELQALPVAGSPAGFGFMPMVPILLSFLSLTLVAAPLAKAAGQPNIVWLVSPRTTPPTTSSSTILAVPSFRIAVARSRVLLHHKLQGGPQLRKEPRPTIRVFKEGHFRNRIAG